MSCYDTPDWWNDQRRKEVDRPAVFQPEDSDTGHGDQKSSDDAEFTHHGICDEIAQEQCKSVNAALPAEENGSGKTHPDSVGARKHHSRYKIKRSIGEQKGVILVQSALHRSQNRERADAEQETSCDDAFAKPSVSALPLCDMIHSVLKPEDGSYGSSKGQTEDEQNRILCVRHVLHHGIDAESEGGHAHRNEERVIDPVAHDFFEEPAYEASHNNGSDIYKCSDHCPFLPMIV